jgi:hypothetical protein
MSRRSRKRYERIYTRRARTGFPRVSKAILHADGTVKPMPPPRRSMTVREHIDAIQPAPKQEATKPEAQRRPWWRRILSWLLARGQSE